MLAVLKMVTSGTDIGEDPSNILTHCLYALFVFSSSLKVVKSIGIKDDFNDIDVTSAGVILLVKLNVHFHLTATGL